ncbi:hypothetical protein CAPGI0001_0405 [Capnocytophaga gingivalis ATCC 33624]|nr:hypothetical protein CAPGI0001_0405 [Capnocytophaga gingivalis ATCC 33624]
MIKVQYLSPTLPTVVSTCLISLHRRVNLDSFLYSLLPS